MIKWNVSKEDMEVIERIADRAVMLAKQNRIDYDKMTALMDINAVHANGCVLDLESLAEADDFNFIHDVFGIRRHIDRNTGKLTDCFLPRYAAVA